MSMYNNQLWMLKCNLPPCVKEENLSWIAPVEHLKVSALTLSLPLMRNSVRSTGRLHLSLPLDAFLWQGSAWFETAHYSSSWVPEAIPVFWGCESETPIYS